MHLKLHNMHSKVHWRWPYVGWNTSVKSPR